MLSVSIKYVAVVVLTVASIGLVAAAEADEIDMSDPTAVYSSVGMSMSEGADKVDVSASFAWGNNLFSFESRDGRDDYNVRYAWMEDGRGFYAEGNRGHEEAFQYGSASVGYIDTLRVNDHVSFYPVAMIGINNYEVKDNIGADYAIYTATVGTYTRIKFGENWHIGIDPFVTVGEMDYTFKTVDAFIGKQLQNHRLRIGFRIADDGNDMTDNDQAYIKWQVAF